MEILKVGQSFDVVVMKSNVDTIECKGNFGIDLSPDNSDTFSSISVKSDYKPQLFEMGTSVILCGVNEFDRIGKLTITKLKSPKQQIEFKKKYN